MQFGSIESAQKALDDEKARQATIAKINADYLANEQIKKDAIAAQKLIDQTAAQAVQEKLLNEKIAKEIDSLNRTISFDMSLLNTYLTSLNRAPYWASEKNYAGAIESRIEQNRNKLLKLHQSNLSDEAQKSYDSAKSIVNNLWAKYEAGKLEAAQKRNAAAIAETNQKQANLNDERIKAAEAILQQEREMEAINVKRQEAIAAQDFGPVKPDTIPAQVANAVPATAIVPSKASIDYATPAMEGPPAPVKANYLPWLVGGAIFLALVK